MKKLFLILIGGLLTITGLIFLVLPGPGIILLILGLLMISLVYPNAKKWLKLVQKTMKKSAVWLDNYLLKRKYSR